MTKEHTSCAPVHSPFGGSVAARILGCPASVKLIEKVPDFLRKISSYMMRGTALHTVTALLIDEKLRIDSLVGETFDDYVITSDDVELALRPVLAWVNALLDQPGAEFYLEKRVVFPTVPDAFGTADLIVRRGNRIDVIDHKFGQGVAVRAIVPDGDEDILNGQLMFYAVGARHTLPKFFGGVDKIALVILQPQSIEPDAEMVSSVTVTHAELDAFAEIYCRACAEALSPSPRLEKGAHCKFCPAQPICPAHTAPLLDLAQFAIPAPAALPSKQAYLQVLADGLNLIDAIKDVSTALREQARRALDSGDLVPGYTLSRGRNERHWRDEAAACDALIGLGLERGDVVAEAMRSVKQIEARAKVCGFKIPPELVVSSRSGTSLVRAENARAPMPGRSELARSFSAAIEAFKGGH